MEISTGLKWRFHFTDATQLSSDNPHVPTDFLDNASHRMAEGPFDLLIVVTDVPLVSSNKMTEAGLASKVTRIVILSTKKFLAVTKDQPARHLHSSAVRWNAAGLLLHLIGHVLGLKHAPLAQSRVRLWLPIHFQKISTAAFLLPRQKEKIYAEDPRISQKGNCGAVILWKDSCFIC